MLRLSKKADYALMAMKHLALRGDRGSSSAREIAEAYDIPIELMAKVLQRLVQRGLLFTRAGRAGDAVKTLDEAIAYRAAFLTDYQGRDLKTKVELALRADGRFLAMRADNISNVGACCVSLSPLGKGAALITGSAAMYSEAIHSTVDTGNELLLLFGMRRAGKPPDAEHPFGYGLQL